MADIDHPVRIVDRLGRPIREEPVEGHPGMFRIRLSDPSNSLQAIRAEIGHTERLIKSQVRAAQQKLDNADFEGADSSLEDLVNTVTLEFDRLLGRTPKSAHF